MGIKRVIEPTAEPLTLAEAKAQCRIDTSFEDDLITAFIASARRSAEHETGRSLLPQTWELTVPFADLSQKPDIILQKPPLIAVVSVKYIDANSTLQTLDPSLYAVDDYQDKPQLYALGDWPISSCVFNSVVVRYTAGYADESKVPAEIKTWMSVQVSSMYHHREEIEIDNRIVGVANPYVDRLLDSVRIWRG